MHPPHTTSVAAPVCAELSKCFLKMWTETECKRLALKSWGLVTVHKGTAQVCPETWRFPCLWRTDHAFQFFPVHLTVLSGKTKTKQFLDNDLKYSKTLHIFIFLSICLR